MKKIKVFFYVIIILISYVPVVYGGKLIKLLSIEYPPYYGKDLSDNGILIKVIKESFNSAGYGIEIDFLPWKLALENLKSSDKYDGLCCAWYSEDREKDFLFSDELYPNQIVFFHKNDNLNTQDPYDISLLENLSIANVKGYLLPSIIQGKTLNLLNTESDEIGLLMLIKNRVDLVIIDKMLGNYLLKTRFGKYKNDVSVWGDVLEEKMQYLIMSRNSPNSIQNMSGFNKGLAAIKAHKKFEQIINEFN